MCLELKCFRYSCKKAWRGEGREKEKAREMFFFCLFVFVCLFVCFFVVFFLFWGAEEGRRGFETSEKFECSLSKKILGGGGGGQERNILRQVRNLNVWGARKFLLKRCYIIIHVVPVKYILSAHIHIPLSNGETA